MTTTLPATETAGPVVGRPIDRVDGTAKTTGAARFSAEYPLPDLAHAALVHSTISRGRITAIGTEAAAAVPGVVAVLTHLNAPPLKPAPKVSPLDLSTLASGTSVDYLNTDEVHWDGQPVAVVVADTLDAAREAAGLVTVTYETRPSTVDFAAEEKNAKPQKSTLIMSGAAKKGDAEAALAAAPVSLDLRFTTPTHHHNAIEPHATTAAWDGDRLTVHDGTQSIDWVRTHLALRFGVPAANVRVIAPFVGGGFGGKGMVWPGTILAALAARATGRPVRLMLTREGVYRTVGGRTPSTQRVALGAGTDGRLTALIHTSVTRTGRVGGGPEQVTSQSKHLYAAENILVRQNLVELDLIPNTSMRAPGESIGTYALEASIDELAYRVGVDPIELRMRNEPAVNPIDGKKFAHRMLREAYAQGAERFGWADRTPEPGSMRDGRWLVGMGVASAYHPSWQFTASVTVRLSVDGTVLVRCGFQEMGMGGATAQAQIAADALGVPFEAVRVEYGDSTLPVSPGAGGSMQTASIANSLLAACEKLKRELAALAKRSGSAGLSPAAILAEAGVPSVEAAVGSDTRFGRKAGQLKFMAKFVRDQRRWMKAACGAQFCEVRVDPDTGEVRVSRWVGVFDVGRVINAKTASSQLRGGIVMGIGMALAEETLVDPRTGRIMNPSLAEYHVPVHADIPPIGVGYLDDPDPTMPLGLIGVGEVGITGVAGAIANAVHHATGKRIYDLPITLDKLL
ncbi:MULTISPECIES: xanthine dehydrogenase family protein molybdopterin-binding subunit [unclassified Amycolatopsis]|uniref:xanthine dehydrogenase family protein molybdopterin-binding subunit n=1 Tax=unclassified Amycolatopsis TaxID=2618356 RepID=UPI002876C702|nr:MULTISPECIES: xanthine dehydrogenase family protein molybdopterin-binding subunit [unclassified Amycolatopsis]MDS0136011.1 xanthine dehydrogenase family protein molybdopterin-binding subunit [Amycolatopsis sp. 505]MDS0145400.1 xanthine dehydrogenase family protein molybdopterin-binding subunit [Amycolatopsis sp. CM201R]